MDDVSVALKRILIGSGALMAALTTACTSGVYNNLDFTNALTVEALFTTPDLRVQVTQSTKFSYRITNTLAVEARLDQTPSVSSPYRFSGGNWPGTAGTCASTLAAGASCLVEIEFLPTARGEALFSTTVPYKIVQQGKQDALANLKLKATGKGLIPGVITPSVTSVSFGKTSQYAPFQYSDKTITLTNEGDYAIRSMSFGGIVGPYTPSGTCGSTLEVGASCTLSVRFQPGAGTQTYGPANYPITYNDGAPVSHDLTVQLAFDGDRDDTAPNPGTVNWTALQLDPAGAGGPPAYSSDTTPILTGTAEVGAIVSIYDGSANCNSDVNKLGEATVGADGSFTVSNITVSTEKLYSFWFRIKDRVLNPAACTDTNQQFNYVAKPAAPASFRTTSISPFQIALAWNDVLNEDAYQLQACSGSGCTGFADHGACTAQNTTSCAASGVNPPERNYRFRIRAVRNGVIYSDWSSLDVLVPAYTVAFSQASYETKVNGTMVGNAVTLVRSDTSQNGHSFHLEFSGADVGSVLSTSSMDVSFTDGQSQKTVTLPLLNNLALTANKTFQMTVTSGIGNLTPVTPSTATVTVDAYTVRLSAATYAFTEGGTNQVTVTRSETLGGTAASVTLNLSKEAGQTADIPADVAAGPIAVNFAAGDLSKTVAVSVVDDAASEGPENFTITLSTAETYLGVTGSASAVATIAASDGGVGFLENLFDAEAGDSFAELALIRSSPDLQNPRTGPAVAEVRFESDSAQEGADFIGLPVQVVFGPGETRKNIRVPLSPALRGADQNRSFVARVAQLDGDFIGDYPESHVRIVAARDRAGVAIDPRFGCNVKAAPFGGGQGTVEDPYRICSAKHLSRAIHNFRNHPALTERFALARDLDLENRIDAPVPAAFGSLLEGREFVISGVPERLWVIRPENRLFKKRVPRD